MVGPSQGWVIQPRNRSFCSLSSYTPCLPFVGSGQAHRYCHPCSYPERFDGLATIANGTKHLVVYVWYDNEYGYSNQVVRFVENIAGKRPRVLPHRSPISEL